MKTNLRPCPFCGKKRHLRFEPFEGSTDTGIVVCICGASYTTIEQGADWNTRPIEDGLQAEIEALQKQVDDTTFMFLERHDAVDELVALGYQFVRAIKDTDRNEAFVEALNKWNEAVKRIRKEREE